MLSVSVFIIIYLFALENSECALMNSPSNSYIKNKLRNTKELLDRSYSLPYTHNKNTIISSRDNFNEIIGKESWKEFSNKSRAASTLFNFNDKIIFIKCVKKLKKLLDYRIKLNIEKNWLSLKKIYLERGKVDSCLFGMNDEAVITGLLTIDPVELKNLSILNHIDIAAIELHIAEKHIFFKNEKGYILLGAITFNGLVNFQEMSISNLSAMYLLDKKVEHLLISEIDQSFSKELRNLQNFIKNLQLNSICELAFKYWLRNHDGSENDLHDINLNSYSVYNETVVSIGKVKSMYRVHEININKINGIDIKNVVNSSFLLKDIQAIRGNVSSVHPFRVMDLRVERINNISSARLLNKVKNESINAIAIDRLQVQYLLVDKINEVTVSDAARMSRENVIKGKVRISNLLIRNKVKVQENVAIPLNNSMQAYEEMLIAGNVFIKNVQIERDNCVAIALHLQEKNHQNEIKQVSSNEALEQSWRKSEEQMISQSVRFGKGASINELEGQYLNGLREQEFAYSGCSSLKIGNVSFNHAHMIELSLVNENGSAGGFFKKFSSQSIVFDRSVRFSHLSVDRLLLDRYNGILVNDIMHASNEPLQSDFPTHFQIVCATEQMHVRQLNIIDLLNVRSANYFERAMRSDKYLKIDKLEVKGAPAKHALSAIKMNNVEIKDLCGKNVEGGLLNQQILVKKRRESIVLTVAEKLQVQNSFNVINRSLNEDDLEHYVNSMNSLNMDTVIERKRIKRMDVFKHLNAHNLLMTRLQSIFAEALSINSHQVVSSSELIAEHIKVDYISIEKLNKIKASSLMHTDTWRLINGSKYFSSLVVKGNVKTKRLKDESAATRKIAELLKIRGAMLNNQSVHIFGFVFWENGTSSSSIRSESVKELFDNAVSKSNDQSSICSLVVDQATAFDSLEIINENLPLILNKILETLSESLIDCEDSTAISIASAVTSKKVLKKKVQARITNVLKSIRTRSINRVRIDQMILQLFRKSEESKNEALENPMPLAKLNFLCELEIESLRTQSSNKESVSEHKFALVDKKILPRRLAFKRLMVHRNVSLSELDKLEFNKFVTNRINIAHPNDVFANVQFNHSVVVLTNSSIVELNTVREKDLVFKFIKASALPRATTVTLIKGKKSFSSILCIESNLDVTSLASNFNDSFFNTDNIEIFGNLEIEEDVESISDILLLGQLNNTGLELIGEKGESSIEQSRKIMTSKVKEINELAAVEPTNKLSGGLFYFERINNFDLHWPTGIQAVTSKSIDDSSTRLDLYISETGTFCGLPIDCPCRAHLLLEISLSGKERVVQAKSSNVLFNFYEPRALLGLRVISEAGETEGETVESVRSGEHCTRRNFIAAVVTIFWTKLNAFGEAKTEKVAVRIEGFIADTQVFLMNNDKLYMILAKFYDNTLCSYSTDSIVYEFDLESKTVNKCQLIATEGAKVLHVFQVAKSGVYALIGCVKGKAESLLMRFDPTTRQFQLIRTFITGGSKHIASLSNENKSFVILSNPDIEALQIYIYNVAFDNFYHYQNLYFQSRVNSLNVLYTEDFGQSNTYFTVTTKDGLFYVYQYTFSGKFKMKISHRIEDFQVQSPFHIGNKNYLFATQKFNSTIFKVVQAG